MALQRHAALPDAGDPLGGNVDRPALVDLSPKPLAPHCNVRMRENTMKVLPVFEGPYQGDAPIGQQPLDEVMGAWGERNEQKANNYCAL